ncbi:hypothetical protein KCG44_12440 [Pacificimonas sp. WHA3]|uniref:Lipoprotein n=1 Tax=Pacificimonas pallii TaxID=2827236 RepID=A0ABS6SGQ6_9SPHN|nr:hypothetical protein [Pacificimonas pallii]MBV7257592.1 hypothetical protein [Pacificimonas pallii]
MNSEKFLASLLLILVISCAPPVDFETTERKEFRKKICNNENLFQILNIDAWERYVQIVDDIQSDKSTLSYDSQKKISDLGYFLKQADIPDYHKPTGIEVTYTYLFFENRKIAVLKNVFFYPENEEKRNQIGPTPAITNCLEITHFDEHIRFRYLGY